MIKLLLLILLFFVGYSFFQALFPSASRKPKNRDNSTQKGEEMVLDPQCGTYIPLSESFKANIRGQQYNFCSRKCRTTFKKKG